MDARHLPHEAASHITRRIAARPQGSGPHLTRSPADGRILGDRYELRRRIGSGGMAEVFLATDMVLQRDVAVKVLRRLLAADAASVDRFHREALTLASLDSPHVVPVYDLHLGSDENYLVMRYVLGRTYEQIVEDSGLLPIERLGHIIGDVLRGVGALHARRLVHRDIKPTNILVDWDERAILVDLGVAYDRRKPSLTPVHATIGTPDFMPPEQRDTGAVDARGDLYQVGLLLLLGITGQDPTQLSLEVRADLIGELPPSIGHVVARALASDPEARFPSADAMNQALERAVDDMRIDGPAVAAGTTVELVEVSRGVETIRSLEPEPGARLTEPVIELRTLKHSVLPSKPTISPRRPHRDCERMPLLRREPWTGETKARNSITKRDARPLPVRPLRWLAPALLVGVFVGLVAWGWS